MYPILITYIRSRDNGQELRHSLRSFKNITNFNGEVYIVGDSEKWFRDIHHIPLKRIFGKPYLDQLVKIQTALNLMPDEFIISQDDIYITEPTEISAYCLGELKEDNSSHHKRTKTYTREKLIKMGLSTKDFEAHAPLKVEKDKLAETIEVILADPKSHSLQFRSLYGNMWSVDYEMFEDKKTKTSELKQGDIISTNFYTRELHKLFPEASVYELGNYIRGRLDV